jgi:hypothetical protein
MRNQRRAVSSLLWAAPGEVACHFRGGHPLQQSVFWFLILVPLVGLRGLLRSFVGHIHACQPLGVSHGRFAAAWMRFIWRFLRLVFLPLPQCFSSSSNVICSFAGGDSLVCCWFGRCRWPLLFIGYPAWLFGLVYLARITFFLLFCLFGGSRLVGGDCVVCARFRGRSRQIGSGAGP